MIDEVDRYIAKQTEHLKNLSPELRKEKSKIKNLAVQPNEPETPKSLELNLNRGYLP